jgi:hypothetical protein
MAAAAILSKMVGRPVKVACSREDDIAAMTPATLSRERGRKLCGRRGGSRRSAGQAARDLAAMISLENDHA